MAVSSALTVLARHGYIERFDISGRRAKGTRLTKPNTLHHQLQINQETLEEKERRDREKLDAMVQLCYRRECRQQVILEYFGEKNAETCGNCDICINSFGGDAREPANDHEMLIVRKALSGVARMSRKQGSQWQGIFGRGRIVQMLMGSKSQEIKRVRLDQLSTHGILKSCGTAYLNELFRSMHDAGLVFTQRGEFPLLTLTSRGEQVMMGKSSFHLVWPEVQSVSAVKDSDMVIEEFGFDGRLFDRLKELRTKLANSEGVPAYQIFPNKTLEYFTRLRPNSMRAGMRIKGVGEVKAEKYLQEFIDEINAFS